jgi:hypothetical protein
MNKKSNFKHSIMADDIAYFIMNLTSLYSDIKNLYIKLKLTLRCENEYKWKHK